MANKFITLHNPYDTSYGTAGWLQQIATTISMDRKLSNTVADFAQHDLDAGYCLDAPMCMPAGGCHAYISNKHYYGQLVASREGS